MSFFPIFCKIREQEVRIGLGWGGDTSGKEKIDVEG
jgi:hypothetical protein